MLYVVILIGGESVQVFHLLFIYVLPLEIRVSSGRVVIRLAGLNPSHVGVCLRSGPAFLTCRGLFCVQLR